ncbi:MAG: sialate O-acetylesterase [Bacteroidetes bacterium]|nr:sialate O-acetylesterase [Bacteroidota bacterium]
MKRISIVIFSILIACSAFGTIKLPAILSDNMVLQQKSNTNLWGWAEPNRKVTVKPSWSKKSYSTVANAEGKWKLAIETPDAGGPYDIIISDGKPVKLSNVLIGEVWICSGQSNMQHAMRGYGGQPVIGAVDFINKAKPSCPIRIANVSREYNPVPQMDCKVIWELNTPEVVDMAPAVGYFFAHYVHSVLDVPIGIINISWSSSKIQAWMSQEVLSDSFPEIDLSRKKKEGTLDLPQYRPTQLYNAMFAPICNFTVRGTLWYQGESNIKEPMQYERMQIALINQWRKELSNPEMPFYYVQIAPYKYDGMTSSSIGYFCEAQADVQYRVKNTGMVVSNDIGELDNIHPANKKVIGERLAYFALAEIYSVKICCKGPAYQSMSIKNDTVTIEFKDSETGLHVTPGEKVVGFELAGLDHIFYPAMVKFGSFGKNVELKATEVKNPIAVRYCFRNGQIGNIFNNYGLPLTPFRTDNWRP